MLEWSTERINLRVVADPENLCGKGGRVLV